MTGVGLGRLEQVGAAVGDRLRARPGPSRAAGAAGDADEGAAGAEVPDRGAQPEQGGDEPDVAGVGTARRHGVGLGRRGR